MAEDETDDERLTNTGESRTTPTIIIHNHPTKPSWWSRILPGLLVLSIFFNFALFGSLAATQGSVGANEVFEFGEESADEKIALLEVRDMITSESVQGAIEGLRSAAEDEDVKAVILDIDSPGGTISGSDELFHAIEVYKEKTKKPVVAFMRGMGTSGAYYISAPADHIIAENTCVTGSIGVIATLFEVAEFVEKNGMKMNAIKSGAMKDSGSPFKKLSDAERAEWQELIDGMYERFLAIILEHRSDAIGGEEALRKVADGRVFLADEALDLGLIDSLGYRDDAVDQAKKLASITGDVKIISYTRPIKSLADLFQMNAAEAPAAEAVDTLQGMLKPRMLLVPASYLLSE